MPGEIVMTHHKNFIWSPSMLTVKNRGFIVLSGLKSNIYSTDLDIEYGTHKS